MTSDDILAYLAAKPKRERPTMLKLDAIMLKAWLSLREDIDFRNDVIIRHGLHNSFGISESSPTHEHAIANAWSHCVRVVSK
jgi:hypothetical protein